MFLGEYGYSIDGKGRITIPVRFREALQEGMVLTRGFDQCLQLFPQSIWKSLAQRISTLSLGNEESRNLRRLVFSGAAEVEPDRQGRILLPQHLREYAGIQEQGVIVGLHTYLEIWSAERWQQVLTNLEKSANVFAEQLAESGL